MDLPEMWSRQFDQALVICRLAGCSYTCSFCKCSEVHVHKDRPTASDPFNLPGCPEYKCTKHELGDAQCIPFEINTLTEEEQEIWNLC